MIHEQGFRRVIVAGVDSYLVAADTPRAIDERDRLLTPDNSNGFIPGEAGGALLVGPPNRRGLCLPRASASRIEQATIESEEPLRADGLTRRSRDALTAAGLDHGRSRLPDHRH